MLLLFKDFVGEPFPRLRHMLFGVELCLLFSPFGLNSGIGGKCRDIQHIDFLHLNFFLQAAFMLQYLADFLHILLLLRGDGLTSLLMQADLHQLQFLTEEMILLLFCRQFRLELLELPFEEGYVFVDEIDVLVVRLFEEIRELFFEGGGFGGEELIFGSEFCAFIIELFILELKGEFFSGEGVDPVLQPIDVRSECVIFVFELHDVVLNFLQGRMQMSIFLLHRLLDLQTVLKLCEDIVLIRELLPTMIFKVAILFYAAEWMDWG